MVLFALRTGQNRKSICCVRCQFSISGKDGTHVDPQYIKAYIARATAHRTPKHYPHYIRPSATCAQSKNQTPIMVTRALTHDEFVKIEEADEAELDPAPDALAELLSVALSSMLPLVEEAVVVAGAEIVCVAPLTTT